MAINAMRLGEHVKVCIYRIIREEYLGKSSETMICKTLSEKKAIIIVDNKCPWNIRRTNIITQNLVDEIISEGREESALLRSMISEEPKSERWLGLNGVS